MKDLIDEIIAEEFASPDLELHWLDEDAGDPETILTDRLKLGALTLNEMRAHLGLDPYANAAADRPMVLTAAGYVPIEAGAEANQGSANASSPAGLTGGSMLPHRSKDHAGESDNDAPLHKYSPDQPRIPAGNSDGGQWTSGGSGSSGDSGVVLAQNARIYHRTPTGRKSARSARIEHADIGDEQQKIADALTLIFNGDTGALQPHPYRNLPHDITGAVLPSSAMGYTAYDLPGAGSDRGLTRLLVDKGTNAIYYTNNHYYSFYPIQLNPAGK